MYTREGLKPLKVFLNCTCIQCKTGRMCVYQQPRGGIPLPVEPVAVPTWGNNWRYSCHTGCLLWRFSHSSQATKRLNQSPLPANM